MLQLILRLLIWLSVLPGIALAQGTPLKFKVEDNSELPWSALIVLGSLSLAAFWLLAVLKRRQANAMPVASAMLSRWLPAAGKDNALTVIASRRLGGKAWLHVVQWDGGKVLLAQTDQQLLVMGNSPGDRDRDDHLQETPE